MKRIHEDKRYNKKSLQAINLADDFISKVKNKEKINLTQLQVSNGYSLSSAKSQKGLRTKTFKSRVIPVIERMTEIRDKALVTIQSRDLTKERLDSLVNLSKQMIHDTQLLTGKATENVATNIVVYGEDDVLSKQVSKS